MTYEEVTARIETVKEEMEIVAAVLHQGFTIDDYLEQLNGRLNTLERIKKEIETRTIN